MNNDNRCATLFLSLQNNRFNTDQYFFSSLFDKVAHKLQTYGAKHVEVSVDASDISNKTVKITFNIPLVRIPDLKNICFSKIPELQIFDDLLYVERKEDRRKYNLKCDVGSVFTEKRSANRRINN